MKKLLVVFIFLFSNISYSQDRKFKMQQISDVDEKETSISDKPNKKFIGFFNANQSSSRINQIKFDTASFPIVYNFELFLDDIYNLDLKNDYFFSKLFLATYLNYDSLVLRDNGKVYSTFPKNNFRLKYFNIKEPYDLKSPSDTFLEDEIFKTITDDDDDGF